MRERSAGQETEAHVGVATVVSITMMLPPYIMAYALPLLVSNCGWERGVRHGEVGERCMSDG
jgi:hypothetical protein